MLIYFLNLALILGLAYPLCVRNPSESKKILYLAATFGFLFFLSAARFDIGNDYDTNTEIYLLARDASLPELFGLPWEKGYLLLCRLLGLANASVPVMFAVMGLLCLLPVAWFIWRYSPNVWLSTWIYVTLTFFYGTMNFVRQNLAAVILLLGYPLLRRRKPWSAAAYAGVILLASSFHRTAILTFAVLLLCYLPLNRWIGGAYAAITALLYFFSDRLVVFVTQYVYTEYRDALYMRIRLGAHFLIIPALVLLLVLLTKRMMESRFPADAGLMVNMMLYSALIWLFITRHMVLERLSLYVYFYAVLAVPMACECLRPDPVQEAERVQLKRKVRDLRTGKRAGKPHAAQAKKGNGQLQTVKERYLELSDRLITAKIYYWCLIAAVLIVTFSYNLFGMYDGEKGFHGVFPYQSLIGFLNRLP